MTNVRKTVKFVPIIQFFGVLLKCHKLFRNSLSFRELYTFVSAQIEMVPQNYQKLDSEEQIRLMEKLIEIMEDDDDVQNVWHNWDQD